MAMYRKKSFQEIIPYVEDMDLTSVSISQADIDNGSPKAGDMIAINSKNQTDRWLIAEKFFNDNYEPV